MDPYPNLSKEDKRLINNIFSFFLETLTCTQSWGFYLFDDEFNKERELRNKLGLLWLGSLFDLVSAQQNQFPKLIEKSIKMKLIHLPRYCNQANEFVKTIIEIIQEYSREEQIFIVSQRDKLVHSYLNGTHQNSKGVKYIKEGKFIKETLSYEQFNEVIYTIIESGVYEDILSELMSRFMQQKHQYWKILAEFQKNQHIIYKAMMTGSEYQWRNIEI